MSPAAIIDSERARDIKKSAIDNINFLDAKLEKGDKLYIAPSHA